MASMCDHIREFLKPGEEVRFLDLFPDASPKSVSQIIYRLNKRARVHSRHHELYYSDRSCGETDPIIGRYPEDLAVMANKTNTVSSLANRRNAHRRVIVSKAARTVNKNATKIKSVPMAELPSGKKLPAHALAPYAMD